MAARVQERERRIDYDTAMAQRYSDVVAFLEQTTGCAVHELVSRIASYRVDDVASLLDYYYDAEFGSDELQPHQGEFWPYILRLTSRTDRNPEVADAATRRALTQLLYAHGLVIEDELGHLLTTAVNPKWEGGKARWDRSEAYRGHLANYVETISYLRPLIVSGLVRIRRRPVEVLWFDEWGITLDSHVGDIQPHYDAIEMVRGPRGLELYLEELSKLREEKPEGPWPTPGTLEESARESSLRPFLGSVRQKLERLADGFPADLSLECAGEVAAFRWMASKYSDPASSQNAHAMLDLQTLAVPRIGDLQPADVLSLHQSDLWSDYRLALVRSMSMIASRAHLSESDQARLIREELAGVRRSAEKTTAKTRFADERRRFGRDLTIGAAVAVGVAQVVGTGPAGVAFAGASGRSAGSLIWAWMRSLLRAGEASPRWFSVLDEPP